MKYVSIALTGLVLLLAGCATIIKGSREQVALRSDPTPTRVEISRVNGETVEIDKTPFNPILSTRKGFFQGQHYRVTFHFEDREELTTTIRPRVSGWYFGNIIFGGLIGLLFVDPATGAMWTLQPQRLEAVYQNNNAVLKRGRGEPDNNPGQVCERRILAKLRNSLNRTEDEDNTGRLEDRVSFESAGPERIGKQDVQFSRYTINGEVTVGTKDNTSRYEYHCTVRKDPWENQITRWEIVEATLRQTRSGAN